MEHGSISSPKQSSPPAKPRSQGRARTKHKKPLNGTLALHTPVYTSNGLISETTCPQTRSASACSFCILFCSAWQFVPGALENMAAFGVYLEGQEKKSGCVPATNREQHPPVWQELACRTISPIVPHNRLTITLVSNSCLRSKGVGLCLPQSIPNLISCYLKSAHPHPLVFCLTFCGCLFLLHLSLRSRGIGNEPDRARHVLQTAY